MVGRPRADSHTRFISILHVMRSQAGALPVRGARVRRLPGRLRDQGRAAAALARRALAGHAALRPLARAPAAPAQRALFQRADAALAADHPGQGGRPQVVGVLDWCL